MRSFLAILLFPTLAFGAKLEDVRILNVQPDPEAFKLKLQLKNGSADSYFFVDIVKSDPESFQKSMTVIKKLLQKERFQLDLEIPSFSASPSGSSYRSESVIFRGTEKQRRQKKAPG